MAGKKRSIVREYVEAIVWAVVLVVLLRAFVIQAFRIPSESMVPTLLIGDMLFVNRFEYGAKIPFTHTRLPGLHEPRAGDIIVFQYPMDPRQDFIKRCVATGGQTIEVRDQVVYVDGRPSAAADRAAHHSRAPMPCGPEAPPYVADASLRLCPDNFGPYRVPADHLFMMGDNRENSADSRFWGPVPMDYVKGRAMFIYWSWDQERFLPRWPRLLRILH